MKTISEQERLRRLEVARLSLEEAVAAMAADKVFGGPDAETSEIAVLEEATALVRQARTER